MLCRVTLTHVGTIELEVGCMVDMMLQHVIPSAKAAGLDAMLPGLDAGVVQLKSALAAVHAAADNFEVGRCSLTPG
jgi:glutamine synthetase